MSRSRGGDITITEPGTGPPASGAVAASAGGVEALHTLAFTLPEDFPAAVLVILHISPTGPSVLPEILSLRKPPAGPSSGRW